MDVTQPEAVSLVDKGIAVGASRTQPIIAPGLVPYAVIPPGYKIEKLEDRLDNPLRLHQQVKALTPDSFVKYFSDYSNPNSRIFADVQRPGVIAVLDYHTLGAQPAPRFGTHILTYEFRHTKEWASWRKSSGVFMDQVAFAQFIEDNLPEVIAPLAADLLQIALRFEAVKAVNFSSGVRLNNGEIQFKYEETISGTAHQGLLEIPDTFLLAIAPFDGSPRYEVTARLRYKISSGGLQMKYELIRPEKVIETAVQAIVTKISEGLPAATIMHGSLG